MPLPPEVSISAWSGDEPASSAIEQRRAWSWGLQDAFPEGAARAAPPQDAGPEDWAHPSNGWGLVLPEPKDKGWSASDKALALDAHESIQRLVQERLPERRAPVFRWAQGMSERHLKRYFEDGTVTTPRFGQSIGLNHTNDVPLYLLIIASPTDVPWTLQFALNQRHHVGRIDPDTALPNYVDALLSDWHTCPSDSTKAVVWTVDHDSMTRTMRQTIAYPLLQTLKADSELSVTDLAQEDATIPRLEDAVKDHPGLIITTSHGQTRPLTNPSTLALGLGLPVDQNHGVLQPNRLLGPQCPQGAIWYAHACCSAGAQAPSRYTALLEPGSNAHTVVTALDQLEPQIAPLPKALLGSENPIRAFIGHVEPTFDWPLRDRKTGQVLTTDIIEALYKKLYQPFPAALGFDSYYRGVGSAYGEYVEVRDQINDGDNSLLDAAVWARLSASDRESLVLLGDPAVALSPLPSHSAG